MRRNVPAFAAMLVALLASSRCYCGAEHEGESDASSENAPSESEAAIEVGTVGVHEVGRSIETTARITFDDLRVAHVFPPVTGRVTSIDVPLGAEVSKGQTLGTITSPDLATALAYHVTSGETPFGSVVEMTGAYSAVLPLTADEVELLPDLVAARLALTIAITGWRAAEYPANAAYILRNAERAFAGLEKLTGDEAATARRLLHRACQRV